jgi:hypothetical protein
MIITINDDWRLASDSLQWVLQRRYQSKGEDQWQAKAFFGRLDAALQELVRRRIRCLPGAYPGAEALRPLSHALITVHEEITAALSTFQTEAAAYHGRAGQ